MPDRRRPTMFPALLAAVAAIAFSVLSGQALEGQQAKRVSGATVSARSTDGRLLLTTIQSSTSADRRRPLEAAFARESYGPGATADLRLWGASARVTVQVFRTGPERNRTRGNHEMRGIPVSKPTTARGGRALRLRTGNWPTGMYFARIRAGSSIAFAPFVLRPRRLGEHRVAVILPTLTWQAYNFRDDDGDGASDTWYADRRRR